MSTKVTQFTSFQLALTLVATATLGGLVSNVAVSLADNQPSTSTVLSGGMVIPYEGYLMLDSTPMNVQGQEVQFELYDAPTGGTLQWGESQVVNIYNGKFSAPIGKGTKIASSPANATFDQVVLDAEKLFLSVKVKDVNGTFVELSGRQAIEAAPYAAWSANSSNFQVAGALGVQGNVVFGSTLDVAGPLDVATTTNTTNLVVSDTATAATVQTATVESPTNALTVQANDLVLQGNPARGDGGSALTHGTNDLLLINPSNSFSGGAIVQSNLEVLDTLTTQRLRLNNGVIQYGGSTITATADLGLYSQSPNLWIRFVTNNGDFAFYNDGGAGSSEVFRITAAGNVKAPSNSRDSCEWTAWKRKDGTAAGRPPSSSTGNINQLVCNGARYVAGIDFAHPSSFAGTHDESYRLYCCEI